MESSEIRSLVLFFFFLLLDEKTSVATSSDAYGEFIHRMKKNPNANRKITLLKSAYFIYQKVQKKNKTSTVGKKQIGFGLSSSINMGPWREFHKNANVDDMVVVVFRQILQISEADIALCLGITPGTVRYRLGKALPLLGEYT